MLSVMVPKSFVFNFVDVAKYVPFYVPSIDSNSVMTKDTFVCFFNFS